MGRCKKVLFFGKRLKVVISVLREATPLNFFDYSRPFAGASKCSFRRLVAVNLAVKIT